MMRRMASAAAEKQNDLSFPGVASFQHRRAVCRRREQAPLPALFASVVPGQPWRPRVFEVPRKPAVTTVRLSTDRRLQSDLKYV